MSAVATRKIESKDDLLSMVMAYEIQHGKPPNRISLTRQDADNLAKISGLESSRNVMSCYTVCGMKPQFGTITAVWREDHDQNGPLLVLPLDSVEPEVEEKSIPDPPQPETLYDLQLSHQMLTGLRRLIMSCPVCGGYAQKPPLQLKPDREFEPGKSGRCKTCGPVRKWFGEHYNVEFESYT